MLFTSAVFLVFLPVVFLVYWFLQRWSLRWQNAWIVVASYVFYGWWDWRYLGLLFISSFTDYWLGLYIDGCEDPRKRKRALVLSLVFNLGILGFFKYYGFFVEEVAELLRSFGMQPNVWSLKVILPVGVSFYTFQSLSYTIEAYRRNFKPERDPIAYLAFVSFFPHMVAGPIMRAVDLLPQFTRPRRFDTAAACDGLRQALWGAFKKIVIADTCAPVVDRIFGADPSTTPGLVLLCGAILFAFQIYGDFSGYSDIAIGVARLFGINLMQNFKTPYFSRSIGDFWRRWHISLSSWFRDFLYIPLGGGQVTLPRKVLNIMITFLVSGLWHGANWTFIAWGGLHGLFYVPEVVSGAQSPRTRPEFAHLPRIIGVFLLVVLAWVFFRSHTIAEAVSYLHYLVLRSFTHPGPVFGSVPGSVVLSIGVLLVIEWWRRDFRHPLEDMALPTYVRWAIYLVLLTAIALQGDPTVSNQFIYFQF